MSEDESETTDKGSEEPTKEEQSTADELIQKPVPAPQDMIDKANAAAERLEKANEERERLIVREEALRVKETLGGKAEAGQTQNKEQSDEDYAKQVMNGETPERPKA